METTSQKPRTRLTTVLVVLIFVFIVIFLLLDFRLITSRSNASSQASTYAMGIDKGGRLPPGQVVDVYVTGGSWLEGSLEQALPQSLGGNMIADTFEVHQGDPAPSENGVLVVRLEDPNTLWTPVYGRADIEILVAYASDGAVDWIDQQTVELTNATPVVRVRGNYQMSDISSGLMSLLGYRSYLAERTAQQIANLLNDRLSNPNP